MFRISSNKAQSSMEYIILVGGAMLLAILVISVAIGFGDEGGSNVNTNYSSLQKLKRSITGDCENPVLEEINISEILVSNCAGGCTGVGGNPRAGPITFSLSPIGVPIDGKLSISSTSSWNNSLKHCFYINDNLVSNITDNPSGNEINVDVSQLDLSNPNAITFDTGTGNCSIAPIDEVSVEIEKIIITYCAG